MAPTLFVPFPSALAPPTQRYLPNILHELLKTEPKRMPKVFRIVKGWDHSGTFPGFDLKPHIKRFKVRHGSHAWALLTCAHCLHRRGSL